MLETLKAELTCRLRMNSNFMGSVPDSDFHRDLEQKESSEAWCEKDGDPMCNWAAEIRCDVIASFHDLSWRYRSSFICTQSRTFSCCISSLSVDEKLCFYVVQKNTRVSEFLVDFLWRKHWLSSETHSSSMSCWTIVFQHSSWYLSHRWS